MVMVQKLPGPLVISTQRFRWNCLQVSYFFPPKPTNIRLLWLVYRMGIKLRMDITFYQNAGCNESK